MPLQAKDCSQLTKSFKRPDILLDSLRDIPDSARPFCCEAKILTIMSRSSGLASGPTLAATAETTSTIWKKKGWLENGLRLQDLSATPQHKSVKNGS